MQIKQSKTEIEARYERRAKRLVKVIDHIIKWSQVYALIGYPVTVAQLVSLGKVCDFMLTVTNEIKGLYYIAVALYSIIFILPFLLAAVFGTYIFFLDSAITLKEYMLMKLQKKREAESDE